MDQQLTTDLYSQGEQSLISGSGESRDTMTSGNADTLTVERKLSQLDLRPYQAATGAAAFGFARRVRLMNKLAMSGAEEQVVLG